MNFNYINNICERDGIHRTIRTQFYIETDIY